MANSKTFVLLGLALFVVLLISSHVSAREATEAAQTREFLPNTLINYKENSKDTKNISIL
jgi:hypothetical protein